MPKPVTKDVSDNGGGIHRHIFACWVVKLVRKPDSGDATYVPLTIYHATPFAYSSVEVGWN